MLTTQQAAKSHTSQSVAQSNLLRDSAAVQLADNSSQSLRLAQLKALVDQVTQSPQQLAQLKALQRIEQAEPLQGKFETVQRQELEEKEPLLGKFETVQRTELEEEEPLQGKFDVAQRQELEEEGPLQAKAAVVQCEGGVPINDKPSYPRTPAPRASMPFSVGVVQAVMSAADFKSATYGFGKRRRSIGQIDIELATYVGARTAAHAHALHVTTQAYLNGNHDNNRMAVVTLLDQRVDAERQLLTEIGDNKAFLVDGLIDQVGGIAQIANLCTLAHATTAAYAELLPMLLYTAGIAHTNDLINIVNAVNATPANINHLPALIALAGVANIGALQNLVTAAGANVPDLHTIISNAGGGINAINEVTRLLGGPGALQTAGGVTYKLLPMAYVANGNWVAFNRLSTHAEHFHKQGVPGMPGGSHLNLPNPLTGIFGFHPPISMAIHAGLTSSDDT